ncbi:MAG: protein-L-isoaspartate(D-aspartate) O-methyltransferase [Xanthomonadales bacterium PRO7]|jgi:protein-L-isoaspartate(D-aspartate) O-methyltransferase|nr:protein-L-isoaspartate(D-aspartate) O-methyltransferase [Xanthomonadales bacterium PRO7]HMM57784.1 protein-L-isoaspartate(D-aspartate) O-methyltransferase [Rudaea sp.]
MNVFSRLTPEAQGLGMTSQRARDRLIARLREEGIADRRVLDVLTRLPRHLFVEPALESRAYEDTALPIGHAQTISQPWVVARMTEALIQTRVPDKVLEIGTGSGYQAAVLAALCANVYTVERIEGLLRDARRRFRKLGIANIRSKNDDGRVGWAEFAPYDAIILTAAGEEIDPALFAQLAPDGVMVAPVGPSGAQRLLRYRREGEEWKAEMLGHVSFVPLLGGVS